MLRVVAGDGASAEMMLALDEICREGARRMLAVALEAEADTYIAGLAGERDENGHRLVVRNGHAEGRVIATGAGPIEITAPRVNDRRVDEATGERCRFSSSIIAPWCRKSPKVSEVLPLMYLHGMSSGDFAPALSEFFGSGAGLSPSVITRLTKAWQEERERFAKRSLADVDYVYCWADGSISTCVWPRSACVVWSSSGSAPMGPKSWWRSKMATGSRRAVGRTCCATPSAAGCERRW